MGQRSRILPWVKVLLAVTLLVLIIWLGKIDRDVMVGALRRWPWLLLGILTVAPVLCLGILRWWTLLRSQGIRISIFETVRISFIGYFFNTVMPGSVGGDLVKAFYVARDLPGKRVEAISTIALDRLIGLQAMLTLASVMGLCFPSIGFKEGTILPTLTRFVIAIALIGAAAWVLILAIDLRKIRLFRITVIRRIYEAVRLYRDRKKALLLALLLSFGAHSGLIVMHLCLVESIDDGTQIAPERVIDYTYLIPVGLAINGIPVVPGGWGLGEVGYDRIFEAATGSEDNIGAELALLMHSVFALWNMTGVFFYLGRKREVAEARRMAEEEST